MEIRDYVNVLVKRWWVIVLTAIAAVGSAYVISKLLPQTYRSQAVYLALANQADNGLNIVLRNSMNSYRELVMQPSVLDQISQQIGLDISGERLMEDVNIQPRPDEQKIVIEVDLPRLDQSQALADAVGERIVAEVNRINATLEGTARINVTRIQPARLVEIRPNTRINMLAGAILGLVLGIVLAFVLEYLDDTLKTSEDVERFVGLPTLGAIPLSER
ncbi:MAG TPA: lipopolysaccharide biosynthesis protein [Chloroflexus aurantiacus]|jgi:capsular polysaccharide biosynthesis protein|uniref:Lipopolysaccharide biosynthesis protein n=1 Tax=Chloroflexus aurantiacus (strain ATCC 29366 / DSM 635 / J-10-fl) TaxID=324602 RepID=A9WBF4_CHLAA|nr:MULTISPECIES: Wzz/FepE/Etk N-terminal domain-containing protein [Chloroflexus]ABY33361.1 lipopolysaccharide biosynthesis protein [Chloroflexus aurantiacus J-10-fl]RMG46519.1 MAG: lipopolysaccharide biosynthesis protein [Chloroflexota bacterium]GIV92977.1 MAG: LPS biosynthesis protein [Chloroflexus sp.]HBW66745.1 lipopolysaccharide biosynthesis protein [Chloroflexus aurantiacus]